MSAVDERLAGALLLPILSSGLIVVMFVTYLFLHRHNLKISSILPQADANRSQKTSSAPHLLFKRPACWLAIKNRNLRAVQSALALHNPTPCSWVEGLSGGGERKLFVSPPVCGWILVIGPALPDPADDVDVCFRFLLELSRQFGQVQFFNANGMLNEHAWVQADSGRILRGYAWAGKTLWNQGAMTRAELALRMKCYNYGETLDDIVFAQAETGFNNCDKVHLLAARWSVDPENIDEQLLEREWGVVGAPTRRF
jgi:hypothetical protein